MKKWVCGILAGALCLGGTMVFGEASNVPVYLDEKMLQMEQPGVLMGDVAMIPLRTLAEQMGCTVTWNEENLTVAVTQPGTDLYFAMYIGEREAFDGNGVRYELPAAPQLMRDGSGREYTMVPVRFISDMLGKSVEWDAVTETVFIDSPKAFAEIESTVDYRKAWFQKEIRRMREFAERGMFYEAESVRSGIPIELLKEAKEIAPDYLAEYFATADTISENLQLMERGEPNVIERELADTQKKIDAAQNLFSKGLFYEAIAELDGIEQFRQSPEQSAEVARLRQQSAEGIKNIPNVEMERVRAFLKKEMYYEAYSGMERVLDMELTAEQHDTAVQLMREVERALGAYEKSLELNGVLYVTNVAEAVNFRASARTGENLISTIPYGSPVDFVFVAENGYYKVKSNGRYGYIAGQFLTEEKPRTGVSGTRYVVCREPIALLGQPSTVDGVQIIRWIDYKESVGFVEAVNSQFARVRYDGDYGYVERQYLSDEKPK